MKLKNFISQTLIELVKGVTNAQEAVKETGAIINPKVSQASLTEAGFAKVDGYNVAVQKVDFNLVCG